MYFECNINSSKIRIQPMSDSFGPFIDAHHHLWDLQACHYPWLMARGEQRFFGDPTPIQRNYLVEDFLGESRRYVPERSVHIQVGVAPGDELKESEWLQAQAPLPSVFVAACDLSAPGIRASLEQHGSLDKFRGVRQILGRHAEEDRKHGSDDLLENPAFLAGLRELAAMGASFDLQMIPPQMERLIALLRQVPELPVALCHCGSPWDQSPAGIASWRSGLEALAELPQVYCKVSGLGMFNHNWAPEDLQPIIFTVIEVFGPQRVMFGSNFPVDKLYNSYQALWRAYDEICAGFSDAERQQMFYRTAADFYRIT
jgi:predicted TIM-barrel fold metal-dependent hydrolase